MQHVISAEEAKKVTKGRTPLVPVEYEAAVKALQECTTLDEAKYWDNKADALAAWAKIYRNDQVGRQAKILKLHAYRRMGCLAQELRPSGRKKATGPGTKGVGNAPGAVSILLENGFKEHEARAARKLSFVKDKQFREITDRPNVPSPTTWADRGDLKSKWAVFQNESKFYGMSSFINKNKAAEVARNIDSSDARVARSAIVKVIEWLDEFEQHLPK